MGPFLTREGEYDLQSSGLREKAESAEHVNVDAESGIVEDVCSVDVTGRWGGKLSDAGEPLLNPLLMVMMVGGPVSGTGRGSASGGRIIPKIDCPLQKTT